MRIHIIAIPHTTATTEFSTCAFTQKARTLSAMMHRRGHEVFFYGVEGSDPECSEMVQIMDRKRFESIFNHPGDRFYDIGYDGEKGGYHRDFNSNARAELKKRLPSEKKWTDIICCPWGCGSFPAVAEFVNRQFVVESGIGYEHTFAKYRVFESYAWLHFHLGKEGKAGGNCWNDAVIPNAFDVQMFDFVGDSKRGENFLFMGRLIEQKGVCLAMEIAKAVGRKITIVGQGNPKPFLVHNPHAEYHPPVGPKERSRLMGEAAAFICPTYYVEPFGGVAVEAQMCGTPAITTDWGAFPETVIHGVTGYRCRTFEQFVWAAKNIDKIKRRMCRDWAADNFSLERVGLMYEEYFQQVLNYAGKGFYEPNEKRNSMSFLDKIYPEF